jgi:hypothetical protein
VDDLSDRPRSPWSGGRARSFFGCAAPVFWQGRLPPADAFPRLNPGDDLIPEPADCQRTELDSAWEQPGSFKPPNLRIGEPHELPHSGFADYFAIGGFALWRQLVSPPLAFTVLQWRERKELLMAPKRGPKLRRIG